MSEGKREAEREERGETKQYEVTVSLPGNGP